MIGATDVATFVEHGTFYYTSHSDFVSLAKAPKISAAELVTNCSI